MAEHEENIVKRVIPMTREKDCKHSVRYTSNDALACLSTVYLSRNFSPKMPTSINVTVECDEQELKEHEEHEETI